MFHQLSKHPEFHQKYFAVRRIFNSPLLSRGGALVILSQPGGPHHFGLAVSDNSNTALFADFIDKNEEFVVEWLVQQGLEKLVNIFKGVFARFMSVHDHWL